MRQGMKFRTTGSLGRTLRGCGRHYPNLHSFKRAASTTSSTRLDLQSVDAKWHQRWKDSPDSLKQARGVDRGSSYILSMFPYPSGTLHLGHLRVYTISDVLARFKHMQGYSVLHPMGWDAFGLPAENAAIERGIDPADWTRHNIAKMKEQLMAMGGSFDWSREFMTCDPSFYKHTQRIFLMLYERGLAYRAESMVNYDPIDRTVLANEQVDANGFSWRSGAKVEKIRLKQWFLRITAFREALLTDLDNLVKDNRWPDRVLSMQRNWLGKSAGANFRFPITMPVKTGQAQESVHVFTTRPDTLYGAQYLALSISHPIVQIMAESLPELRAFIDSTASMPPDSKVGFLLPDVRATNPLSMLEDQPELVHESLPVYVAPYVLGDYGEGAVMGVPGHDTRDHAFWRHSRGSEPVRLVVEPSEPERRAFGNSLEASKDDVPYISEGILTSNCGKLSGFSSSQASTHIVSRLEEAGAHAEVTESWRLRDWLISRQRYWGTPIPMIHCNSCGAVPVPMDQLPVALPKVEGSWIRGKSGNPLEDAEGWVNTKCPSCGGRGKRDTDTMDTFVDSSWYYARFADPHNPDLPFGDAAAEAHLPVDVYVGGVEHAILHLLYARFISKFLATTDLWPSGGGPSNKGEPFRKLITQGMVHGKTYTDSTTGRFLKPEEVDLSEPNKPRIKRTGEPPNVSWEKMSKSKYNGVDPADCIRKYGADATRAHILFQAPVGEVLEWHEEKIVGIQRWFGRVWRVIGKVRDSYTPPYEQAQPQERSSTPSSTSPPISESDLSDAGADLWAEVQRTIHSVTHSLDKTYSLNTVVSDLIKLTNRLSSSTTTDKDDDVSPALKYHATTALLRMMAPLTPAFAEECWEALHSPISSCIADTNAQPKPQIQSSAEPQTQTKDSIFAHPFPAPSLSPIPTPITPNPFSSSSIARGEPNRNSSSSRRKKNQTCAVQENGKLRFAVEINTPPEYLLTFGDGDGGGTGGKGEKEGMGELERWVLREIWGTERGRGWFEGKGWDGVGEEEGGDGTAGKKRWKRVIVVRGGRTVNFVV